MCLSTSTDRDWIRKGDKEKKKKAIIQNQIAFFCLEIILRSLVFDRGSGLSGHVIEDAGNAGHFVGDALGDFL